MLRNWNTRRQLENTYRAVPCRRKNRRGHAERYGFSKPGPAWAQRSAAADGGFRNVAHTLARRLGRAQCQHAWSLHLYSWYQTRGQDCTMASRGCVRMRNADLI